MTSIFLRGGGIGGLPFLSSVLPLRRTFEDTTLSVASENFFRILTILGLEDFQTAICFAKDGTENPTQA